MMKLSGTVSIGRGMSKGSDVTVQIIDSASGCVALELTLPVEAFADALFSRTSECSFAINDSGVLGATQENKTELVPFDCYGPKSKHPADEHRTKAAVEALAPFEVDGWYGRASDLFNGHCREKSGDAKRQRVVFYRYMRDGKPVDLGRGVRRG